MSDERSIQGTPQRLPFEVGSGPGRVVLKLADGTVLHVHPIIVDVMRNGTSPQGEPIYTIAGGLAVRVMERDAEESK